MLNNGDLLINDIKKLKKSLIAKAKSRGGIYENFGDKEIRMLKDKFSSMRYSDMDSRRFVDEQIDKFESWCMNADDRLLNG